MSMTHTQTIIEDAKKAGWHQVLPLMHTPLGEDTQAYHLECIFIDPLFWQAVGKTRGWDKYVPAAGEPSVMWKDKWHRFIDHLADGDDIEEALGKL